MKDDGLASRRSAGRLGSARRPAHRRAGGFALVLVLLIVVAVSYGAISLVASSHSEMRAVSADRLTTQCRHVAETAVTEALGNIVPGLNTEYQAGNAYHTSQQQVSTGSIALASTAFGYEVNARGDVVVAPQTIFDQDVELSSQCQGPTGTTFTVRLGGRPIASSVFKCGFCACDTTTISGGTFVSDSYDSSVGAYGALVGLGLNIGTDGNVCGIGDVDIANGLINGSVSSGASLISGSGGTVTGNVEVGGTIDSDATIGGSAEAGVFPPPHPCNCDAFDVDSRVSAASATNDNASAGSCTSRITGTGFQIGGSAECTLPAGTYYFTSFRVQGNARVRIDGEVTMYWDGNGPFDVRGSGLFNGTGLLVETANARNLQIFHRSTSGTPTISIRGTSNLAAYVYAPDANVDVSGTPAIFGAITAGSIENNGNVDLHYDEAAGSDEVHYVGDFAVARWSGRPGI